MSPAQPGPRPSTDDSIFVDPHEPEYPTDEWVEEGVVRQVVFEIDSPSNTAAEMARKLAIHDRRGVEEYYYYDPETGKLEGWIREAGALGPIADVAAWTSPRLGIRFKAPRRKDALIVRGPDGKRFRTFQQVIRAADEAQRSRRRAERHAREAERQAGEEAELARTQRRLREAADLRAEGERELREAADLRAERLEAILRAMGVDPGRGPPGVAKNSRESCD
jgi:hypothetical protein